MLKRYLAIGLVAIMSLGILAACGSSNDDSSNSGTTPGQSSNAPAIFTATAQSEIEDTWTPTPEPVHEETVAADETGGDSAAAGEPVALQIASVDIAFDVKALEGPADTDFTITLTNNGAADHDFVIEGTDFATSILAGGESETITVNLPAGEYTFFCSVPGHRPAGMEGTLTITAGGGAAVASDGADAEGEAAADDATADDAAADEADAAAGAPVELQVSAVDIAYEETELEAPANTDFTITLTNNGMADHNLVIEGTEFTTAMLSAGETETITVNLPAGEYIYYCSVPGHRQAGMEGTLIVSEGGGAAVAPANEDTEAEDAAADEATAEGDAAAAGEPVELQVSAVDIAYEETELEAPANTDFTITLTNNGMADHNLVIEGTDFTTAMLSAGETDTITVNLPAGEYIFYCSVPGHRQAGMEGTLTITEGGGATVAPAGDDSEADDAASYGPVELQVTAVDIDFVETELEAPADTEFTITLTNNGMIQHDFVIEGTDFKTERLNGGETETLTITLPAGEYTYYCSVPGHRAAGMEGTLIVTEGGGASIAPAGADEAAGGSVDVQVSAIDIAYEETELEGPADTEFTITVTNNGAADHDFVIEGTDIKTSLLGAGESETITVTLPAGEYTFFCSVPGHRPAGMEGTLTISAGGGAAAAPASEDAEEATAAADSAAASEPVELQVSAIDIAYDVKELEGPADTEFTITVTNNGNADHDFVIEGTDFKTALLGAGESETITMTLPAGEYTFFCSVPGHRPAGMEGTLTITAGGGAAAASSDDSAAGASVDVQVSAIDIAYEETELEGPADTEFTITVTNNGAADHDFVIEGTDFKTSLLRAGQSETITVTLPAGEYTFFCSVPGHRPAGMEGTLVIK